jgi:hypothetical protein
MFSNQISKQASQEKNDSIISPQKFIKEGKDRKLPKDEIMPKPKIGSAIKKKPQLVLPDNDDDDVAVNVLETATVDDSTPSINHDTTNANVIIIILINDSF